MAEGTIMVLRVDLGCDRCYKKIKKLICKIPQIRDQTYNEKEDTVTIKVVCCSPEKIRDKLICKGGKTIKSIEIRVPKKPETKPEKKPPGLVRTPPKTPPEKPGCEGHCGGPCHCGCGIRGQPPSYTGYVKLVPSYDGWPSGCRCNRSYGCCCEFIIEENPPCTIM